MKVLSRKVFKKSGKWAGEVWHTEGKIINILLYRNCKFFDTWQHAMDYVLTGATEGEIE